VAELCARLQRIEQRHDALRRAANDLLDQLELLRDRIPAEVVDRLRHDIGEVRREAF
jgi:predicted transcriptional regulator